jgi:prolyl oligopeptidase
MIVQPMPAPGRARLIAHLVAIALALSPQLLSAQSGPPPAPVRPVTDTLHGVAVTDPYRWMEDEGPELTDWLTAQDAHTRAVLAWIPGRDRLLAELRALTTDAAVVRQARRVSDGYVYLKRNAGEQVPKLYLREVATGEERLLVDPATLGDGGGRFTIGEYAVSPDGRYVAVHVAQGGSEVGSIRFLELLTGEVLPHSIDRVLPYAGWRPDGKAMAYLQLRDLPPGVAAGELELCMTTYLHLVGTDPATDRPLVGCGISSRIPVAENQPAGVLFPLGSRHALGGVMAGPRRAVDFYAAPVDSLAGGDTPWRRLTGPEDEVSWAALRGDTAYLVTTRGAPRRQVVRVSVIHPDLARAEVVVPQSDAVIEPQGLYLAQDGLYVRLLDGGMSRLLRVPFDGSPPARVRLPYPGAIREVSADPRIPGVLFSLESWMRAPRIHSFDPESGTVRDVHPAPPHPADRPLFRLTRVEVRSADGTRVPLSILAAEELRNDGSHPALVEGYGAYGATMQPRFRPSLIPWLERGGIYALCHARGGGEHGDPWYRAGHKENKPNTIADFIACADYLVAEGYTTHARLAGSGGSAGGLTIGGAITRRPDLFTAGWAMVPVADLLRFEFSRNGPANIPEFGTVTNPDDFRAMRAVSPYENIVTGTRYPAVLVTTGINDRRVPPSQAAKLAARLQAATASGRPVLLRVDWGTGHGIGTTTADQEEMLADAFSFLLWQMGMPDFQPRAEDGPEPSDEPGSS